MTKKLKGSLMLLLTVVFLLNAVWLFAFAESVEKTNDSYSVIVKDEAFAGVNLNAKSGGALNFVGDGNITVATKNNIAISYNFGAISVAENDGILVSIDRSSATEGLNTTLLFSTESGTVYKYLSNKTNDKLINDAGETVNIEGWHNKLTISIPAKLKATLFIPWSSLTGVAKTIPNSSATAVEVNSAVPSDAVFKELHYIATTTTASMRKNTRLTSITQISSLKLNSNNLAASIVTNKLDVSTLSYSSDASSTTSDVNLADMTKGTKIFSKYGLNANLHFYSSTQTTEFEQCLVFSRNDYQVSLNYIDSDGETLATQELKKVSFNASTGKFAFDFNDSVKTIGGYTFNSQLSDNLVGELSSDSVINIVYDKNPGPILTQKFIDEDGNEINRDIFADIEEKQDGYFYDCSPVSIFGYEFISADKALTGSITENSVISFTYKMNQLDDYDIIYNSLGKFAGVNIKTSTLGTVLITGKNSGKGTADLSLTTFEFGKVSTSDANGILIQIDRSVADGNQIPRILLETEEGILYKVNQKDIRNDIFVLPDGTVSSLESESFRYNMEKEIKGTLYIPFNVLNTTGSVMPYATVDEPAGNVFIEENQTLVFKKMHFGLDTRAASWQGADRPTGIGVIAAISIKDDKVLVEELLNTASLNYSYDASVAGDVNMVDNTLGSKIYISHSMTGAYKVDTSSAATEEAKAVVELKRLSSQISIVYLNEKGDVIKTATTIQADYTDQGAAYSITPPVIVGYDFKSADRNLEGITQSAMTITLTYSKKPVTLTLKFVDEQGNKIAEDKIINKSYGEYIEIPEEEISNYQFKEASSKLNITLVGDRVITMTYTSVKSTVNSLQIVLIIASALVVVGLAGFGVYKYTKTKEKK